VNIRVLKEIIAEQREYIDSAVTGVERDVLPLFEKYVKLPHTVVVSGLRRAGKSTLLCQVMRKHYKNDCYYLSFEDERLLDFTKDDFNLLYEAFMETQGEKKVFFFDEIQNVPEWEAFVRRMQDRGFKFFITGSNASLLSKELSTKLTGRCVTVELFPFSFGEYLRFKGVVFENDPLTAKKKAGLKKECSEYLTEGGLPEFLKYKETVIQARVYEDILYRDIVSRHGIKEIKSLREMAHYYISNVGKEYSYNNIKEMLKLGSENTVKSYTGYMEDSYLFLSLNKFSFSLKKQNLANKKIYCIDTGIAHTMAFKFSMDHGHLLENMAAVELRRRYKDIYYYKTDDGLEVDFLAKEQGKYILLQVTSDMSDKKVREREIAALTASMKELKTKEGFILTENEEEDIKIKALKITVIPLYKWLLSVKP